MTRVPQAMDFTRVAGFVGAVAALRGAELFADDAVVFLDDDAARGVANAFVTDGGHTYDVEIDMPDGGAPEVWCSCGGRCGHIAATLFSLVASGAGDDPVPGEQRRPTPAWQRELDAVLPGAATQDLALFVAVRRGGRSQRRHLALRPGIPGARGNWIFGNVQWHSIEHSTESPRRRDLLVELRSRDRLQHVYWYPRSSDWLEVDEMRGHGLVELLSDLRDAGVAFVSSQKRQHPVRWEPAVSPPDIEVTTTGKSLRVAASVPADAVLLGEPAAGYVTIDSAGTADERVVLTPFTVPLEAATDVLVRRGGAMRIAAQERERFERDYLPRLRAAAGVVSPDGSVAIPDPVRVRLRLELDYDDGNTLVSWSWDRGPGDAAVDFEREASIEAAVLAVDAESVLCIDGKLVDRLLAPASAAILGAEILPRLREIDGLDVVEHAEPPAYRRALDAPVVGVEVDGEHDWFDLHVTVSIEGKTIDFAALFTALSVGDPVMVLADGTFFDLDVPELRTLRALIDEAHAMQERPSGVLRVSRYQVDWWEELQSLGIVQAQANAWLEVVRAMGSSDALVLEPQPEGIDATLRAYQQTGYSWLHFLRTHGLGGVLADDMGLGKTLQVLTMIARARDDEVRPFLIVAPTSVVGNWASESRRFAPELRVAMIEATERRRGVSIAEMAESADVVVTSHTLFRLEFDVYQRVSWAAFVIDEAQLIKNHSSEGYRCARALEVGSKFAVTGTPLENNLQELWALVSLTCPGLLGPRKRFLEHFARPIERERDTDRLATLQRRLRPFLLRRRKEEVAAELPARQEQVLDVHLESRHRRIYDVRLQRERQRVLGLVDDVQANRFEIFRSLTALRQLALDTELVGERAVPSAKLDELKALLVGATSEGHKVLVFSQFTRFLGKARELAIGANLRTAYIDGSTRRRQQQIEAFKSGAAEVLFISLKAGGFGLNLVEADYVVLLDPWWNPATERQAIDRAHRIGQTKSVMVYRLVARDTIEGKVMALKEKKAALFQRVLDAEGAFEAGTLTADDIRSLIE